MTNCPLCHSENEHIIWQNNKLRVITVHNEVHIPAFCRVIWHAHCAEMTDLNPDERQHLMDVVFHVEAAMRDILQPNKINLASLGNMVPHLHWHIIARFNEDAHFPAPVWSKPIRPDAQIRLPQAWPSAISHYLQQHLGTSHTANQSLQVASITENPHPTTSQNLLQKHHQPNQRTEFA